MQGCKVLGTVLVLCQKEENLDESKILRKPGFVTSVIYRTAHFMKRTFAS